MRRAKSSRRRKRSSGKGFGPLPDSVDLYYGLGVLFEKTDRFEESIAAMKTVLKFDPDHAEALNFIGYLYADRGIHLDEAERMIKKALPLKPGNGYMIDSLGWVYFRQNRLDEAIRYLKEASEALPEDAAIIEHLGDVYVRNGADPGGRRGLRTRHPVQSRKRAPQEEAR